MENQEHPDTAFFDAPQAANWAQTWRLRFIDFRLRWEGRLNRRDVEEFFGISAQQATHDLAAYTAAGDHDNLRYEPRQKAFVAPAWFRPLYPSSAARYYLTELVSLHAGLHEPDNSFVGWRPAIGSVAEVGGRIDGDQLALLLKAIRERRVVNARVVDVERESADFQLLSPHGLANEGRRWYVRAYRHGRKQFTDINLAWIEELQMGGPSSVDFAEDMPWHTELPIQIEPQKHMAGARRRAIELDYGMQGGGLQLTCRQSMLIRTLQRLELHRADTEQLRLVNRGELQPFIDMMQEQRQPPRPA